MICNIMRSVTQGATHSFAHSIKSQHRARQKLTREIAKHDAKLAHQNLRRLGLSRDIDVFVSHGVGEVSELILRVALLLGHPSSSFVGGGGGRGSQCSPPGRFQAQATGTCLVANSWKRPAPRFYKLDLCVSIRDQNYIYVSTCVSKA